MTSRLWWTGLAAASALALFAVLPWLGAADPPRPADPGGGDDVQDVVFLTDARPFVFRLHLFIDGQPFAARWNEHILKVFAFLDRDEDGFLTSDEAALAPSPQQMGELFHGTPYTSVSFNEDLFKQMDTDGDKKVSPAEFLNYYRRNNAGPVQLSVGPGRSAGANALTDVLFEALDTNKDGKLSKAELLAAEAVLHKYDENDDEIITAQELLPTANVAAMFPGMMAPPRPVRGPAGPSPLILVPKEEGPKRVTQRLLVAKDLLARYDKDKNGKLSPAEIGLPKEVFDQFDVDKDGELDKTELLRWILFKPDLEATLHLGRLTEKDSLIDLTGAKPAVPVQRAAINTLSVNMEDALINLIHADAGAPNYDAVLDGYLQQFEATDVNDRGYITREQVDGGKNPALSAIFRLADRDDNGKLTKDELKAWGALTTGAAGRSPTITLADNGRALFEMIDANNDGRLTIRKLRTAWSRLAPYDRDGDGGISRNEIPQQFQMMVGQGPESAAGPQLMLVQQAQPPQRAPAPEKPVRGPLWFRKMDVNGDGDISPREWLGSREDFKKIDTDGDGLISLEEAEAYDALMRKQRGGK